VLKTTDSKSSEAIMLRRCTYCPTPFKHPVSPEGNTAACPECGASDSSGHRALPEVETLLTKPGTGFQLLNATTGKEIMAVRCLCGHLFDFPRWEIGTCPSCEREFLIPPPPIAHASQASRHSRFRISLARIPPLDGSSSMQTHGTQRMLTPG
jgi:hypothetical protein